MSEGRMTSPAQPPCLSREQIAEIAKAVGHLPAVIGLTNDDLNALCAQARAYLNLKGAIEKLAQQWDEETFERPNRYPVLRACMTELRALLTPPTGGER